MENRIEVRYRDFHVGTIARYKNKYVFQYSDEWIEKGFSISPFSLPLKKQLFIPKDMTFNGFFGVFADSLPDAWGNLLLERYLKSKGIEEYDGLYKLASIGNGGMGALEYIPSFYESSDLLPQFDEFQKEANAILANEPSNIDMLYRFGGSSGGARPKAILKIDGVDWIVKFQSSYDIQDSGVLEYEYAQACKRIGINMPDVKLFESNVSKGYFGIKRFDRVNGKKIHMISAAALLEADFRSPCADYNDLFKLTKIVTKDNREDLEELYLRMCFNVFAHNLDDHLKNFSFIYDEETRTYRLSPAYDMTYSNTYYNEHTTTVNHKGKNILDEDMIFVGTSFGLKKTFCLEKLKLVREIVNQMLKKYTKE